MLPSGTKVTRTFAAMVYLTRRLTFNAAHKLSVKEWSDEQNQATFGKCANANWHGHNYVLYITVAGTPDPTTGYVIDAKTLADIGRAEVTEQLDHRNLNLDVPWLEGIQPTTENLAMAIWGRLSPKLTTCRLHRVRLMETENIFVDYFGD